MPLLAGHGLELSMLFGLPCFLVAEQYSTTGKFVDLVAEQYSTTGKFVDLSCISFPAYHNAPPSPLLGGIW